jgi:hypothetical protein
MACSNMSLIGISVFVTVGIGAACLFRTSRTQTLIITQAAGVSQR